MLRIVGGFLGALLGATSRAMRLDSTALSVGSGFGWWVPVGVALVAGISVFLGQGVVLAINRVRGLRRLLTMIAAAIGMVAAGAVEAVLVSIAGFIALGDWRHLDVLLPTVLLASAPYWLGFLVAVPYSGPGIARLLNAWHLVCLWALLVPVLGVGRIPALLVAGIAWLATMALDWINEHSPLRLRERVFRLITGTKGLTGADVLAASAMGSRP